jgi:hypothetical protein
VDEIMAEDIQGDANGHSAAAGAETEKSEKLTAKEEKAAKRKALLPFAIVRALNCAGSGV